MALALFSLACGCGDSEPDGLSGSGNSTSRAGGDSSAEIVVRDGLAVCVFAASGKEYKVGKAEGDQVSLFATFGGVTVTLRDLEAAVSGISAADSEGANKEPRALANALLSQQLPGIRIVEEVSLNGQAQTVRSEEPGYLVIRADNSFRLVKKGRKPEGTWKLDSKGQFVMDATNDDSKIAKIKRQPGDKLELSIDDNGKVVVLRYGRSDLVDEPKAIDEE